MRSRIILLAVLSMLTVVTLAFGGESGGTDVLQTMKSALPQILFITVLLINLISSMLDHDRNFIASFIATVILAGLTYWGGFYKPLIDFLSIKL